MDEQINNIETAEEKVETPVQEKRFTQAEVDKILKDRLKRESESFKSKEDSFSAEIESLKGNLGQYEEEFGKFIAPKLATIPEEFKELVDKLPILEKIAFLNKMESKKSENTTKFKIPQTPNVESETPKSQQPSVRRII